MKRNHATAPAFGPLKKTAGAKQVSKIPRVAHDERGDGSIIGKSGRFFTVRWDDGSKTIIDQDQVVKLNPRGTRVMKKKNKGRIGGAIKKAVKKVAARAKAKRAYGRELKAADKLRDAKNKRAAAERAAQANPKAGAAAKAVLAKYRSAIASLKSKGTRAAFNFVKKAGSVAGLSAARIVKDARAALTSGRPKTIQRNPASVYQVHINPLAPDAAHQIEVSHHFRGGGKSFRQRVIEAGQMDFWGESPHTNPAKPIVKTYQLKASNGRPVRKATMVTLPSGLTVHFIDKLPKVEAIKQAEAAQRNARKNPGELVTGLITGLGWGVGAGVGGIGTHHLLKGGLKTKNAAKKGAPKKKNLTINVKEVKIKKIVKRANQTPARARTTKGAELAEFFKTFRGHEPSRGIDVCKSKLVPNGTFEIGTLQELPLMNQVIKFPAGWFLVGDSKGNLHITGRLKNGKAVPPFKPGQTGGRDVRWIDEVKIFPYGAVKSHLGGSRFYLWVHKAGEEGGRRPVFGIDREGYPVLRGGDYEIRREGIVN